jgi:glycosyltransferase involved in cell wall biosynthesis
MLFKGGETLLQALAILNAAGARTIKARIAGVPESSDVMRFYARKARQFGVAHCVEWLGRLPATSIVQELLRASVCVNPTHIDNSPNSLVEAMLVGVPTVASRVGGIPSLVENGVDGWLYPDGDAQALAEKIQRVLQNPLVAAEAGQRARERSLQRNDPENIASAMLHIYKEIIANA